MCVHTHTLLPTGMSTMHTSTFKRINWDEIINWEAVDCWNHPPFTRLKSFEVHTKIIGTMTITCL